MKIIIAGAGAVGFHLAELLCIEEHDITLIDRDEDVLHHVGTHLDVLTISGDAASIHIMEEAHVDKAELFIAVTTSEKTNLLLGILAKQMGAKRTIARVMNPEYFSATQKEKFRQVGIDTLISPLNLAAQEIERLLKRASFTDVYEFEQGKISVVGFTLDTTSPLINRSIEQINALNDDFNFRGVALLRDGKTLIPRGDTIIRKGDHLYIAAEQELLDKAMDFAGKQLKPIKRIMIIGDTPLALRTAELLENKFSLTIVMKDPRRAKKFIDVLNNSLIIVADPGNMDVLKREGIDRMDAFIALTPNPETNIITSLMAEHLGVYKTISSVDNVNYTHISQDIGIDTIINKKLIAANNIFRFVRKGKIEAIASLHGVDAEIIEFIVHKNNRVTKKSIRNLHFPKEMIIAGVVRGQVTYIPDGDFVFEMDDKVIVLALPRAISQVEQIFK